jgi:SAM-dependent methyltransferase
MPLALARPAWRWADLAGWRYAVPGERSTCPACGTREVEHLHPLPLHDRADWRRVGFASGCRQCGLVFANPMPTDETLSHMYSPDGRWGRTRQEDDPEKRPSLGYLVRLLEPVRAELDVDSPPPGAAVLDFGCGSGEILDALKERGWNTFGIEPAVKTAFVRHRELEVIPGSPSFRLVVAHHVLEHVPNPLAVLRSLADSVIAGGHLLVSVPRLDTLPQHRDFRYCVNDRAHVVSYTADAMATLMSMAGLQAVDLNPPADQPTEDRRTLRRLRMIGRKGGVPSPQPNPLAAARRAFEQWAAGTGAAPPSISVRARAAIMNVERLHRSVSPLDSKD